MRSVWLLMLMQLRGYYRSCTFITPQQSVAEINQSCIADRQTCCLMLAPHLPPPGEIYHLHELCDQLSERSHIVELNRAGMEEWRLVNKKRSRGEQLAEFPGTIFLGNHNFNLFDKEASLDVVSRIPRLVCTFCSSSRCCDRQNRSGPCKGCGR